jgi:hypothetical protein
MMLQVGVAFIYAAKKDLLNLVWWKVDYNLIHNLVYASTAMGTTSGSRVALFVAAPSTSFPSQNLGSSLPGMNNRSTLSSVMTHIRIVPPEEPSRAMARARATKKCELTGLEGRSRTPTILNEFDSLVPSPAFLEGGVTIPIYICGSRP